MMKKKGKIIVGAVLKMCIRDRFNTNYNNSPVTCYDDYQLFITGETHYRALFQDIKEAKENIYVLFYAIHHDVMGEALVKILTEKAKEGVTVLVMCDFIANLSTPYKRCV